MEEFWGSPVSILTFFEKFNKAQSEEELERQRLELKIQQLELKRQQLELKMQQFQLELKRQPQESMWQRHDQLQQLERMRQQLLIKELEQPDYWELKEQQSKLRELEAELIVYIGRANLPPKEKAKLEEQTPSMIGQKGLTDLETSFGTKIEGLDAKVHEATKNIQHLLKGSDRTVMLAARSLGLGVEIKPILVPDRHDEDAKCFVGDQFEFTADEIDDNGWESYLQDECFDDGSHIFWCQKFKHWQPAVAALVYGNEHSLEVCYQAAAILVTVPAWSERHHNTAPPDEPVQLPQTGEDKD